MTTTKKLPDNQIAVYQTLDRDIYKNKELDEAATNEDFSVVKTEGNRL
jgi:hypothetical protein